MSATTKKPDPFSATVEALRALYDAEVVRLADDYRSRILAGEFSGPKPDNDGCAWQLLADELMARHPWCDSHRMGRLVVALSPWAYDRRSHISECSSYDLLWVGRRKPPYGDQPPGLRSMAADLMARDVMTVAVERGWLRRKPRGDVEPMPTLRVA